MQALHAASQLLHSSLLQSRKRALNQRCTRLHCPCHKQHKIRDYKQIFLYNLFRVCSALEQRSSGASHVDSRAGLRVRDAARDGERKLLATAAAAFQLAPRQDANPANCSRSREVMRLTRRGWDVGRRTSDARIRATDAHSSASQAEAGDALSTSLPPSLSVSLRHLDGD